MFAKIVDTGTKEVIKTIIDVQPGDRKLHIDFTEEEIEMIKSGGHATLEISPHPDKGFGDKPIKIEIGIMV